MALSLIGAGILAGSALAQSETRPSLPVNAYNSKVTPWPGSKPAMRVSAAGSPKTTSSQLPPVSPSNPALRAENFPAPIMPAQATSDSFTKVGEPKQLPFEPSWSGTWNGNSSPESLPPTSAPLPTPPRSLPTTKLFFEKKENSEMIQTSNTAQPPMAPTPRPADPMPPKASGNVPIVDLGLPSPEAFFRLESEAKLQERVGRVRKGLEFPTQDPITKDQYAHRGFAASSVLIEPHYVCYRRLFFEDKNTERYGWSLGPLQPFVSAAMFYNGITAFPYKFFSAPGLRYDSSAGLPLPGDPVPQMLYPPGLSATGGIAQAGFTVALYYIFP